MKIAIPIWGEKVSPVFDTAARLMIFQVADRGEPVRFETPLYEKEFANRCYRIQALGVDILICGAISRAFSKMLSASGVNVISWISGDAEEVFEAYIEGKLNGSKYLMPGCGNHNAGSGHTKTGASSSRAKCKKAPKRKKSNRKQEP
jgi:predicted Fe-Mo cluster-binding NifX family protein